MKFFDKADKLGLKIPINQNIRALLDHKDKRENSWKTVQIQVVTLILNEFVLGDLTRNRPRQRKVGAF